MGADHVGPVEHDGHLGAEAPRQVVGGIEGAFPLPGEVEGRPAELGHVVPVDEDERAGHPQQMLGRRPRVVGDGTGKGDGASRRGRHGHEPLQPVGERTSGRGERSHLGDAARPRPAPAPEASAGPASSASRCCSASSARRRASSRSCSVAASLARADSAWSLA